MGEKITDKVIVASEYIRHNYLVTLQSSYNLPFFLKVLCLTPPKNFSLCHDISLVRVFLGMCCLVCIFWITRYLMLMFPNSKYKFESYVRCQQSEKITLSVNVY